MLVATIILNFLNNNNNNAYSYNSNNINTFFYSCFAFFFLLDMNKSLNCIQIKHCAAHKGLETMAKKDKKDINSMCTGITRKQEITHSLTQTHWQTISFSFANMVVAMMSLRKSSMFFLGWKCPAWLCLCVCVYKDLMCAK